MSTTPSLRVHVDVSAGEVLEGTGEIKGTLTYREDGLEFSYYTTNLLGQASEYKDLRIPLENINKVVFKSGMIFTKLILYPTRLDIMAEMPGEDREKMVFQVKRADREMGESFATFLQRQLYETNASAAGSLPFQLPDTNMGFTENSGLLYREDEFLVFDLHSGLAGITKSDSQIVKIELQALESVRRVHGNLKDVLYIKPKKPKLLEVIPGDHEVEVKLKVSKQHRENLENLIRELEQAWGDTRS